MAIFKERYIGAHILKLCKSFPVILLTGARQVGKTTLLKHLRDTSSHGRRRNYVSLDEFEIRRFAKSDPGLFLEQYQPPLIIDEIQYAPQLLNYIKSAVDRGLPMGSYWLTGSQQFHLMRGISESLAGRVGIIKLLGISQAEENELPARKEPWLPSSIKLPVNQPSLPFTGLFKKIVRGSFPRLLHRTAPPWDSFYGSYIQTYIDRDLRTLIKISSLSSFEKFLRLCAGRTASILNISDLARDSEVTVNTAKAWLSLLEASDQIFFLRPYYKNLSKRLIKAPKLYFFDTGLVCYLTGWSNAEVAMKGAFAGALFETFVMSEIIKSYYHRGIEPRLFYYRTKEKMEIDLLIEKNGKLFPIEIKLSSLVKSNDIKGIYALRKTNIALGKTAVIATPRSPYALEKEIFVIPPTTIQ